MLFHAKYKNSNFTRIQSVRENIQCPILLCFGLYTPTPHSLSCKIQKFYIEVNRQESKYYLGTPMLKAK